jgi:hypothetical protein
VESCPSDRPKAVKLDIGLRSFMGATGPLSIIGHSEPNSNYGFMSATYSLYYLKSNAAQGIDEFSRKRAHLLSGLAFIEETLEG